MARRAQIAVEHVDAEEVSTEEDDGEEEEDQQDEEEVEEEEQEQDEQRPQKFKPISLGLTCHVCGRKGHKAGFVGSKYMDCPYKPCYLCKQHGHTTATCPFKIAPGYGKVTSKSSSDGPSSSARVLMEREQQGGSRAKVQARIPAKSPRWQVESAILKLHTRRCCTLEFHPSNDSIVLSGDKKGQIAVWNMDKVHERTLYSGIHRALLNGMCCLPWLQADACCAAASDGKVTVFDIETGVSRTLLDLNPDGWTGDVKSWRMVYGCHASEGLGAVVAGDNFGVIHLLDPRASAPVSSLQCHKPKTKVTSVHINSMAGSMLLLTGGNDHTARLFDVRALSSGPSSAHAGPSNGASTSRGRSGSSSNSSGSSIKDASHAQLALMDHPRVVNAAYFSPHTGHRILTTCQDNHLRVWDYHLNAHLPPDHDYIHSHEFNRYLTPFKAEWMPTDLTENMFLCGRYISEDFGGTALHPIDIMDASSGVLLQQLTDANLTTICPVNKPHPRRDVIVSGSSRSLYMWAPVTDDVDEDGRQRTAEEAGPSSRHPAVGTSSTYVFVDADPNSGGEKKKRKSSGAAGGSASKKPAGKRPPEQDDDDDDDD